MDEFLEIRKLPYEHRQKLTDILNDGEKWKILMAKIPKNLTKDNYKCRIEKGTGNNKYNSDHARQIKDHAIRMKTTGAKILLDEWSTSGRETRPLLGHLLYLLTDAQLILAADYVSIEILRRGPVPRPQNGPAARVPLSPLNEQRNHIECERMLDPMNYPVSSAIEQMRRNSLNVNINHSADAAAANNNRAPPINIINNNQQIPKIVVNQIDNKSKQEMIVDAGTVVVSNEQNNSISSDEPLLNEQSTTISSSVMDGRSLNIPNMSIFCNDSGEEQQQMSKEFSESNLQGNLPNFSLILTSHDTTVKTQNIIPKVDVSDSINSDEETDNLSDATTSGGVSSTPNLPNLSILNDHSSVQVISNLSLDGPSSNSSDFLKTNASSGRPNMPELNQLLGNNTSNNDDLNLNTHLPQFDYSALKVATNNFADSRLLGAGSFGAVYLGQNLLFSDNRHPYPELVAIKKLLIPEAEKNDDDHETELIIIQQFQTEVEILSKYQHDYLLKLLGYSLCDGRYCLIYEYISGGTLEERLKKIDVNTKLIWTERLYIANGTAKAIAYLHSAFSTPLVHCDIKSANIMIDVTTNKPKLCDFGFAKLLPNQKTISPTIKRHCGTPAYMAPEAFLGKISTKLDTYSFGVVLLELLTSLPVADLKSHVDETCSSGNSISPMLDRRAGPWTANGVDFGEALYGLAVKCGKSENERPEMRHISFELGNLFNITV